MPERKMLLMDQESADLIGLTLAEANRRIDSLIKFYGDGAIIDWYEPPYCDSKYLYVYQYVPETDDEYSKRLALELMYKNQQDSRDLAEYDRLAKKLGKV